MQIFQSETFKNEYKKITDFINQSADENRKNEVKNLLKELVNCVKKMDSMHADLISIGKLSDDSNDLRARIVETRKKIFRIVDKS
jgi:two-component sensor histidine kinase